MTVEQLIEKLKTVNPKLEVYTRNGHDEHQWLENINIEWNCDDEPNWAGDVLVIG